MQRFVIELFLLAFCLAQLSCTSNTTEVRKDTLYVALGSQPTTLDPRIATDTNSIRVSSLLFNSLVRIGPKLQVEGDAARKWERKAWGYEFRLYPHMKFSNGRELTKGDLLFTFKQYQSPKNPFSSALGSIKEVKVTGNNDQGFGLELHLKEYSAILLSSVLPIVKILPQLEIESSDFNFSQNPMGTGSFKLVSQDANQVLLRRVPDHAIQTAKIENLVFKIIRDDFTRFQKTLKGSIDIAQADEIAPSKVGEFEKRPDQFQVFKYPGLSMTYLLINLRDPILSQLKVRQALSASINREEIMKYKLEGLATEATSILSPSNPYHNPNLKNPPYDYEKAHKLIHSAGLEGKSLVLKTSNNPSTVDKAKVIAYQISKTGLKMELQSYEWGTYYSDVKSGNFQIALMRWTGSLDPDIYRLAFHSKEVPPGRNRGYYINKTLDQLVDSGLQISDEQERIKHYQEVQKMVMDDLAIIPLWYDLQVAIVHKRVQGYIPWQTSDFYSFLSVSKDEDTP